MRKFYISLMFFSVFFILIACEEKEDETSDVADVLDELNELSVFEEEVKELIIDRLGPVDEDGNDRIEEIVATDGSDAENMINEIEQDDSQENLDTSTKAMLRESFITVTINATQDEILSVSDVASILHEFYDTYNLDRADVIWNISDIPDDDAQKWYGLTKQTEAELDWDEVFDALPYDTRPFISEIDNYIPWPIE